MKTLPILSICAFLIASPLANAASFTIQPQNEAESKDTKVYASLPTSNFSSNLNVVSADITTFSSLVQFNLSAIAVIGADDISSAVLRLYVTGLNLNAQSTSTQASVNVAAILNDWRETAASVGSAPLATYDAIYGSTPTITYGSVVANQTVTGVGYYDWDITATVRSWQNSTLANYGLLLTAPGPQGDVGIADTDSHGAAFAPSLIVQTVPEPSALAILASSAGLLLLRRRK